MFILQDDLGWYDVFANRTDQPSSEITNVTARIQKLIASGIVLERHYAHWHCSPSRRSFLTGRLPHHHGEYLSDVSTDEIDLRWRTIGQKLEHAGCEVHPIRTLPEAAGGLAKAERGQGLVGG